MPICFNNSKIPVAIRLLDTLRETSFKMDNAFFIFKGFFLSETYSLASFKAFSAI